VSQAGRETGVKLLLTSARAIHVLRELVMTSLTATSAGVTPDTTEQIVKYPLTSAHQTLAVRMEIASRCTTVMSVAANQAGLGSTAKQNLMSASQIHVYMVHALMETTSIRVSANRDTLGSTAILT